jgi:hypothetical protein
MTKRISQPKIKEKFQIKKTAEKSYDQRHPVFSLQYLQSNHCISRCEMAEKAKFADTLRKLSQFTWLDLKLTGRHQLGYEKIEKNSLKVGIPAHLTEDINIIAFRFDGKKSMVGYRINDIFYIVWVDRNFSVYKH